MDLLSVLLRDDCGTIALAYSCSTGSFYPGSGIDHYSGISILFLAQARTYLLTLFSSTNTSLVY